MFSINSCCKVTSCLSCIQIPPVIQKYIFALLPKEIYFSMTAKSGIWLLKVDFIGLVYDICGARITFFIKRKGIGSLVLSFAVIQKYISASFVNDLLSVLFAEWCNSITFASQLIHNYIKEHNG